jgi:hypothetical protein
MHSSVAFVLAATLIAQQSKLPPFVQEHERTLTYYYQSPNPELGPQLLKELLDKKNLEHRWFADKQYVLILLSAQFGDIAAGKPKIVRKYEAAFASASPAGRRVILGALENCGDKETLKQVDRWLADPHNENVRPELETLQRQLKDPNHKHVRDRPARTPDDLDLLWVNYFITGDYAPISRLLDVLDLPDRETNQVLKGAARWSIGSNLQQHPKLVELVQKHAKERSAASQKTIADLIKSSRAK